MLHNPGWDSHTATFVDFDQWSVADFESVFATDNPDLGAFNAAGGKVLVWHGL